MFDVSIELLRACFTAFIVYYLYTRLKKSGLMDYKGWRYILYGFSALLLATILDITDNIPGLEKYVIIGDTVPQAVLEKIFGYLLSSVLVLVGFIKLIPLQRDLVDTRNSLEKSESRYRDIVQSVNSIILRWDKQGRVVFLNEFGQKLFGYTSNELVGRHVVGTIVPAVNTEGNDLAAMIDDITRDPAKYALNQNENICKDGRKVMIQWSNRVVYDDQGRVAEILSVGTDISKIKELENELRQAQKMEAMGNLAGGIAHDFNNILLGVLGFTELSQLEVEPKSRLGGYLRQIKDAGERARDLVKQILTFSRKTSEEKKPVRLAPIVHEAMKLLRSSIPVTIEIKKDIEDDLVVMADASQLHQIVMNLVTNAFHAMQENGGVLAVSVQATELAEDRITPCGRTLVRGRYARLEVVDTGTGMDQKIVSRIFEPYFSTKGEKKGSGLGLAVVHGIVAAHKGCITVDSTPNKGTTFTVYLPLIPEKTASSTGVETEQPKTLCPGRGEIVLFVDDEEQIRNLAEDFLAKAGFCPVVFDEGSKVLRWLEDNESRAALLITDMTMPAMTGKELVSRVRKLRKDLPIIICSGYSEGFDEKQAIELGAMAYMDKPFSFPNFMALVRKIIDD